MSSKGVSLDFPSVHLEMYDAAADAGGVDYVLERCDFRDGDDASRTRDPGQFVKGAKLHLSRERSAGEGSDILQGSMEFRIGNPYGSYAPFFETERNGMTLGEELERYLSEECKSLSDMVHQQARAMNQDVSFSYKVEAGAPGIDSSMRIDFRMDPILLQVEPFYRAPGVLLSVVRDMSKEALSLVFSYADFDAGLVNLTFSNKGAARGSAKAPASSSDDIYHPRDVYHLPEGLFPSRSGAGVPLLPKGTLSDKDGTAVPPFHPAPVRVAWFEGDGKSLVVDPEGDGDWLTESRDDGDWLSDLVESKKPFTFAGGRPQMIYRDYRKTKVRPVLPEELPVLDVRVDSRLTEAGYVVRAGLEFAPGAELLEDRLYDLALSREFEASRSEPCRLSISRGVPVTDGDDLFGALEDIGTFLEYGLGKIAGPTAEKKGRIVVPMGRYPPTPAEIRRKDGI